MYDFGWWFMFGLIWLQDMTLGIEHLWVVLYYNIGFQFGRGLGGVYYGCDMCDKMRCFVFYVGFDFLVWDIIMTLYYG